jgi:hydroxyacylglutathione hydrolase
MLAILPIPILQDNYVWLGVVGDQAFVVDPGEAAPVQAALQARHLQLAAILITHHHGDHVGGVDTLFAAHGCPVFGPLSVRQTTEPVCDGERITLPGVGVSFDVIAVPGHTLDHLAYAGPGILFCGDTLFACGCGRLFEGSAVQMQASLARLMELPVETFVYCTHEYTLANQRFALAVDPGNDALRRRADADAARRALGQPTVPFTLAGERACNPFLRWHDPAIAAVARQRGAHDDSPAEVFGAIRRYKDVFA